MRLRPIVARSVNSKDGVSPVVEPETAAQRRRRRTRVAISQVAVRLFAEHGYAATSTEQIAAAADVSRSTLFRYFADKDDLVFALEDELLHAVAAAVREAAPDRSPWAALHRAAVSLAGDVTALRDVLLARERVIAIAPALQARGAAKHRRWEETLTRALLDDHQLGAVDAALLAKSAVACFEVAQQRWLAGSADDLAAVLEETFTRLPGLLGPEPR